jgi:hypothetical protein
METNGNSLRSKLARWAVVVLRFWPSFLVAFAGAAFAVLTLSHPNDTLSLPLHPRRWEFAVAVGLLALAGEIAEVRRQARIPTLEASERRANEGLQQARHALERLARVEVARIAASLRYSSSERVSLFAYGGDCFVLVARYSPSPPFTGADRQEYPLDAGCLGRAWESDRGHVVVTVTRDQDPEQWRRQHMDCRLSREFVDGLRMPVRTVIASRVNDPRQGQSASGVVVLESTDTAMSPRVSGANPPILDPADAANALGEHMESLVGILAVFAELEDRAHN